MCKSLERKRFLWPVSGEIPWFSVRLTLQELTALLGCESAAVGVIGSVAVKWVGRVGDARKYL